MKLVNNSVGVINVDGKFILPGQSVKVADSWASNAVVKGFLAKGLLKAVKEAATFDEITDKAAVVEEAANLSAESSKRTLTMFAKKYGINVDGAETAADIYAVIHSVVETCKKNA